MTLTTDASKTSIGACLTQEGSPVIYISKTLTSAERKDSNIEREALAIVYAVTRLRHFLLGRRFTINTDHKPLEFFFDPGAQIPKVASARIARWAIKLMAYNYVIAYRAGREITHADGLFRLSFDDTEFVATTLVTPASETPVIDVDRLKGELMSCSLSRSIRQRIIDGNWKKLTEQEKAFEKYKDGLTIQDDLIYVGTRL